MVPLLKRFRQVLSRAIENPGKEYRRLRWQHGLPVFQRVSEGVGVYLYPGEGVSEHLYYRDFEPAIRQVLRDLLRPGMTFIDAGANLGLYTAIAAKLVGNRGRVFAFEPSHREVQRARKTVLRNGLKNVEVYRAALGQEDGIASLTVCEAAYGAFNSVGRVTHRWAAGHDSHVEQVACRALDSFVAEKGLAKVDVVKIDVEGAEESVLRGGKRLFSSPDSPTVICELSDWTAAGLGSSAATVWDLLSSYGYHLYSIDGSDDGYRLRPCGRRARIEYEDVVALKPSHRQSLGGQLRLAEEAAQRTSAADVETHG
jgi:FkbM family methyltransferase